MLPASRRYPFLLALAACLALPPAVRAQADAIDTVAVDALVQGAMKAWQVPGAAVVIVRGDEVVYLKGHGVRELGGDKSVTPDTLFAIASTSKAFTTTAIAILADDGKLKWDDPVRKHIDFFRLADPLADENVTLRDLVTHRTGLSRNDLLWLGTDWSREELLRRVGHVKLNKSFRSSYQYQNIMYLAAGYAAGKAAGSSWEDVVQKRLFDPLSMTGANFSAAVAQKAPDHATPHLKVANKIETVPWRQFDHIGPAGSINAGVRDLGKWLRFQLGDGTFEGKRLLSARLLTETHAPQMVIPMDGTSSVTSFTRAMNPETNLMNYGLGWTIQDYRTQVLVSHGGSIDGFRAQVALVPKAKLGIAILSNLGRTQFPEALRNALVDQLLNLPKRDWNAHYLEQGRADTTRQQALEKQRFGEQQKGTKPARELSEYARTFEEPAYGQVTFALENGGLVVQWYKLKAKLEHYHYDTFQLRGDPLLDRQPVTFHLGTNGEVERVTFIEQEFKRVKK